MVRQMTLSIRLPELHLRRRLAWKSVRTRLDERPTCETHQLPPLGLTQPPPRLKDWPATARNAVVRQVDHRDWFDVLFRANRVIVLGLLWSALVTCMISSVVYDVWHWLNAW